MKKIIVVATLVFLLLVGFFNRTAIASAAENVFYQSPCQYPRTFSIGSVDPRFNISESDFLSVAQEAGSIWKNDNGQALFVYDPKSNFPISLIYDERQYLNNKVDTLNNQVQQQKNNLKPEIAQYEQRAAAFKKKNAELNAEIDYWNNKGGAPSDEYNKLMQEQKDLQQEAQELQAMAKQLNQSTDAYNAQIQELDKRVEDYNQTLTKKPEEGEYIRNGTEEKILIYFNNSRQELLHTIAHEMGHGLGMGHNDNPAAIMYPKTNQSIEPTAEDIAMLADACKKKTIFQTLGDKFLLLSAALHTYLDKYLVKPDPSQSSN